MQNLWAPWRMQYIAGSGPKQPGCFFCNAWNAPGEEEAHLVVARGEACLTMLNRYPYSGGHLMVAPARHFGCMEEATPAEAAEMWRAVTQAKDTLARAMRPEGFNIGINQGKCAGAGVLDHLHIHVVPRWEGDTNFMPVMADVRVMPQALVETWKRLRAAAEPETER